MKFVVYTDGGARGNPGPAGIGYVVLDETGSEVFKYGEYIGETTNNVAEYSALVEALKKVTTMGGTEVVVKMDSELVVRQMNGQYKIKDSKLKELAMTVKSLTRSFSRVEFVHIYREANKVADMLVNQAIDSQV